MAYDTMYQALVRSPLAMCELSAREFMAAHRRGYVIAIDFDGTLCSDAYPDIGNAREAIIKLAKEAQRYGANIVLWTCREGDLLNEALTWCKKHGLQFAAVNDNIPARKAFWGNNTRKVGYDEIWDDRAVRV
ncbi:hypothetical protein AGMMS49992_26850 [Clostridia bacterium]|nr:hypothetical protein AGMMS49992_26850 [Clostridia bacterium]